MWFLVKRIRKKRGMKIFSPEVSASFRDDRVWTSAASQWNTAFRVWGRNFQNKQYLRDVPEFVDAIEVKRLFHRNIVEPAYRQLCSFYYWCFHSLDGMFSIFSCLWMRECCLQTKSVLYFTQAKPYFSCNCIRWIFKLDYRTKKISLFF